MSTRHGGKVADAWFTGGGAAEGGEAIMQIKRIVRHLRVTQGQLGHAFPPHALKTIEEIIKASEAEHTGKIRFMVEGRLARKPLFKGQSARDRATDLFAQLPMRNTRDYRGLLIYLLLADRRVEILADRRISVKVPQQDWSKICRGMEAAFKQANYATGVVAGVQAVTRHLATHFPADAWQC
jgi:uncharacterized membrane protein